MAENSREIVLDALLVLERGQEPSHRLIRSVLDKYDYLESREKSFIKRTIEGTIERQIELDYDLDHVSSVPSGKMKPLIRCLLRMSAYQLLYMDHIPDRAVINEAVNLAGKRGFRSLKGFVNGVLRNLSRSKGKIPLPDGTKEFETFLSVKYSMPLWLVKLWISEYGREVTERLLAGLLRTYPVSLRFVSGRPETYYRKQAKHLAQTGARLAPCPYLPYVYWLEQGESVRQLAGFKEGKVTVQDVSSALAVEAAGIRETDLVLDVCAAPGGKSILAAEKAKQVIARDVSEEKARLIQEYQYRMSADRLQVQVHDATVFDTSLEEKADVVLLDVPCSGLGVIGKKRDIKYRVTPERFKSLEELQRRIVDSCWRYVKPGGTLLYSTCTIHIEENEAMVKYIAGCLPFEPVSLEEALPGKLWEEKQELKALCGDRTGLNPEEQDACIQLMPGYMECDGFFFAKFRRRPL